MKVKEYKTDCVFFNGYKPCEYQKKDKKVLCNDSCKFYIKKRRVLILKKGAIGEVMRSTVLFHHLKDYEITILTDYPEIINKRIVKNVYKCRPENYLIIKQQEYDLLLSLDKEQDMCALANEINARVKKGFYLDTLGKIMPIDKDAVYLWKRGIDDAFMKNDKKNYSQLIIEASGFKYKGEEQYVLPIFEKKKFLNTDKKIIGLNTGSSKTWKTRIWPENNWIDLAEKLIEKGYEVVLLGGPDEDEKNKRISKESKAKYFGVMSYVEFISLVDNCDTVVTAVTFTLHVAIGLKKKIILFNNIFNKYEFLFEKVNIIEPKLSCLGCYKIQFDKYCPVTNCMELITVDEVYKNIIRIT